jgi:hypothetical protein
MTWRRFLQWVADNRPTKQYNVEGEPLFRRSYLFTVGRWVWYLHHYFRGDPDARGLHNHPFVARGLILAGGYDEERVAGVREEGLVIRTRRLRPGRLTRIDQYDFHRVVLDPIKMEGPHRINGLDYPLPSIQPTSWSLFVVRYTGQPWGFFRSEPRRLVPKPMDGVRTFTYTDAGPGISKEEPWWRTAPKGKDLCLAPASTDKGSAEPEPVGVDRPHVGGSTAGQ